MLLSRIWRDTLSVDEPQVLLYLDDMKITPSNPRLAKPPIARVTSVEVPGAGADPDSSSEAPGAGVRPGIEFWLERVMDEAVQFGPDGEKLNTFLETAANTLATWMAGRLRVRPP